MPTSGIGASALDAPRAAEVHRQRRSPRGAGRGGTKTTLREAVAVEVAAAVEGAARALPGLGASTLRSGSAASPERPPRQRSRRLGGSKKPRSTRKAVAVEVARDPAGGDARARLDRPRQGARRPACCPREQPPREGPGGAVR